MLKILLLLFVASLLVSISPAGAETMNLNPKGEAAVKTVVKEGAKELVLTVTTPTHELLFSEKSAWTIRQMSFNGKLLLSQTGAFGSVATSKGIGWEGTGHGHETVEKIELEVDGKSHTPADGMKVSGDKFVLKKQSRFGPYRHHSIITLDGKNLHEKFDYEVVEDDSKVTFIYGFMHCMSNRTDKWMAQPSDGEVLKGEFLDDNSYTLKQDIRWAAIYSSADEIGFVYMYPEAYKGMKPLHNFFWNRPRDNKLYFRPYLPRGIGKKFGYEVTLQAFSSAPEKWEGSANEIVAELKK